MNFLVMMCYMGKDSLWKKLENIEEEGLVMVVFEVKMVLLLEILMEMMEFLGRLWSILVVEFIKVFFNNLVVDINFFFFFIIVNINKEVREDEEDFIFMVFFCDFVSYFFLYFKLVWLVWFGMMMFYFYEKLY